MVAAKPKAKAKAKAAPKAKAVPKARAKGREPAANDLRRIEKIKLEMPDRVRKRTESNVVRNDLTEAQARAAYAGELDRLHGESGLLHGNIPAHMGARMATLGGALRVPMGLGGLPVAGSAQYPHGIQPHQY